jgi:hypothetical protein
VSFVGFHGAHNTTTGGQKPDTKIMHVTVSFDRRARIILRWLICKG